MSCPAITLSPAGPALSRVVAGMWRMAEWGRSVAEHARFIEECIDLGVTTFDHADIYGGGAVESLFGQALACNPLLKKRIQIVTKCGIGLPGMVNGVSRIKHYNLSATHVSESVDRSLQKLGVECLDVLLVHRPSPLMDFDELAATFERLRQVGKVLHFGVSNFTPTQFAALHRRFPLVTNQVEFSPLHLQPMEDGVFEGLQDQHVSPMIWSALGGGQLFSGSTTQAARVHRALTTVGHAMGLAPAAVVYAWIMCLPCRPVPLTGSGRIAAVRDAVAATQVRMELLPWFEILEAARGVEVA